MKFDITPVHDEHNFWCYFILYLWAYKSHSLFIGDLTTGYNKTLLKMLMKG